MKPKKQHEVRAVCNVVGDLLGAQAAASVVVDLGSGKGYVPQWLAAALGATVVCVEGEAAYTASAKKRLAKIVAQIAKREPDRAAALDAAVHHVVARLEPDQPCPPLVPDTLASAASTTVLMGLHTCGDLAATVMRSYVASSFHALALAPCCYNLRTEAGFPLSIGVGAPLADAGVVIGGNERNTSVHCVHKWADAQFRENELVDRIEALFVRAAAGYMATAAAASTSAPLPSGSAAIWRDDALATARRLAPDADPTHLAAHYDSLVSAAGGSEELAFARYSALYTLLNVLAPVLEMMFLVDGAAYLHEAGIHAQVREVFDGILSPRAHMIIARRSPQAPPHLPSLAAGRVTSES
ncbi:uncharacterized protein AMSG_01220 [Thecamonas trahens ATCC 50062]|uniref:Methyltransferase domain-containing protein n=1 Tax=Thecamonas trahens ATCC 50062 TaxID=461836 RepID=A0A0L0DMG5_THETB|nr:hypothetical protein AMSG_01220 [Thecamonas trahens ATCC 50062]KNC53507.1 hypothetical protein AMSG_01220 [Thecamonas trahens ATCC 50062]|eukprot:XP_013761828.1 hypothetical protein AMSG_01220 [Thecamonas trahens ATCC 50062]